jgi:hypothetical protein
MQNKDTQISPLRQAAIQLHELYVELRAAGFARKDALTLVGMLMISGVEDGLDN